MGPFMVEIVFCRVTRRGRKKRKGQVITCIRFPGQTIYRGNCTLSFRILQNKNAITDGRNEGPAFRFVPQEDTMKVKAFEAKMETHSHVFYL